MAFWLLKTEPDTYSYDDLAKAGKTAWDGVANATALKNLRTFRKGDLALIYHTGKERAAVGIAKILGEAYPDPKAGDEKLVVVDLEAQRKLSKPVTLDAIKLDKAFAGWDLLRIGRLSVVSVTEAMWKHLLDLAK